jgi:hypothetical protein
MRCSWICWERGNGETFTESSKSSHNKASNGWTISEVRIGWYVGEKNVVANFEVIFFGQADKNYQNCQSGQPVCVRPKYTAETSRTSSRRWSRCSANYFCVEFSTQIRLTMKCTPPHNNVRDIYEADAEDELWLIIHFTFLFWSSKTLLCRTTYSFNTWIWLLLRQCLLDSL